MVADLSASWTISTEWGDVNGMSAGDPTATSPLTAGAVEALARRRLVAVFGPAAGWQVELGPDATTTLEIGREPPSGLALTDDTASRRHVRVEHLPRYDCVQVTDLGSKNGTFVDGRRIEAAVLESGSVLRIGGHLFVLDEVRLPPGLSPELRVTPGPDVALARAWTELQITRAARATGAASAAATSVVIRGPTGAGKERLAAQLHRESGRPGAFVPVNCATLNRELLGSELFGHVKGAFSGAHDHRAGLIASADRGTLFLDEIAELPLDLQPSLLRVLQEGRLRAVGSDRETSVEVRVVSATHRDLEAECEAGRFREDLYARLAGLVVELPGVAHRQVEILPLLSRWVSAPPSLEAAEALLRYAWPRNIRELQAVANQIALFGAATIEIAHLPEALRAATSPRPRPSAPAAPAGPARSPSRAKPTRDELEASLRAHRGRVADVARGLALTRQSVYRLLDEYGLEASSYRRRRDA